VKNLVLIFLLTLLFSNVFFVNVNSSLIGDGYDNYEFFGFMNLAKENILAFKHPFSQTNTLRYPDGFDFSYGYDGAFAVLSGAFLSILLGSIIGYNLTIVLILFLNIYLSFYYLKKFGQLKNHQGSLELKSMLAAIIFGVSPYVFARINGHLNLALVAGFPMFIYYYSLLNKNIVQRTQEIKKADYVGILIAVLLIGVGSLQYLILLAAVLPIVLLLTVKREDLGKYKEFLKNHSKNLFIYLSFFVLVFTFLFHGYIAAIISGDIVFIDVESKFYEPHVVDVFIPNQYLGDVWGLINPSEQAIERVITVGTVEFIILLYLLIKIKDKKVQLLGISMFLVYLFLAFGIWEIPYYSEGGRVVILLSLFIALVLVSYDYLFTNAIFVGLILTMVVVERLFFNVQVSEPLAANLLHEKVSNLPGEAVLNVPLSKYSTYRSALPVFYGKKVLDGYFHYTAATDDSEKTLNEKHFSRLVCQFERGDEPEAGFSPSDRTEALEVFREKDIGSIVLFKDQEVGKLFYSDCSNVRDWWYYLNPETLVLSKDTPGVVKNNFRVASHNPHTISRFYFERDGKFYLNGLLVAPAVYQDLSVYLPSGEVIYPVWQEQESGLSTRFDPPLEVDVKAGDYVTISSDQTSEENRYINAYYVFLASKAALYSKSIPIELVYSDYEVEIFQVN